MIFPGLVSVTFRQLSPLEIVKLASQAGLFGIEWGGDIHVPHGDLIQARSVRALTEAAGLQVAAYGSYYRVWPQEPAPFESILETALALGAPVIRVWAGKQASSQAAAEDRAAMIAESQRIAALAAQSNIVVAFEFHANTLTDTDTSAFDLLTQANQPNLRCYWQPRVHSAFEENLASLKKISPWLQHLHVFQWQAKYTGDQGYLTDRRPLSEGRQDWQAYLAYAQTLPGNRHAMLEFVRNDSPELFLEDAQVLIDLCSSDGDAS